MSISSRLREQFRQIANDVETLEVGVEIAYRRTPTQEEAEAHAFRRVYEEIQECHVPMGDHHGHKCRCGNWVFGGPTVCDRCNCEEAINIGKDAKDAHARMVLNIGELLEEYGCHCDCRHSPEDHTPNCNMCLACRIAEVVT
jgi:hypothetical protein